MQPMYGTGWLASGPKFGHSNNHEMHNYPQYPQADYNQQAGGYGNYNPPPAYGPAQQQQQYTGTTFNPNDGYYGAPQNSGVQPPQNVYQRDDPYPPPPGPPPTKY